jgi:Bacterial CdiA-CT RNAse A domain
MKILRRQEKFNPYHDDAGRFTTADGVGGGGGNDVLAGGDGNDPAAGGAGNDQLGTQKPAVNLLEEDARGGHAVRDHVAKSDAELIGVVQSSVIRGMFVDLYKDAQGSFLPIEAANDFTNRVLERNASSVDAVASGALEEAWLAERFGYPTGKEAFRAGANEPVHIRPTYAVGVLIRHDKRSDKGYRVHTAYPVNEKAK